MRIMGRICMKEKKTEKIDLTYLLIIFIVGVIGHFLLANFSKTIETYPDELRYYMIGRSIYLGEEISIRGIASNFQKISYAVLLSPFFAIENAVLRVKVISLFNSIIMMLSIFPAWGISKELNLSKKYRYCIIALAVIWPDMMLSMTFMSEILYWPLFLLFIYIWIINEKKQKLGFALFEGILCYLIYLTKEIFLAMLLAYCALELCYPFIQFILQKKSEKIRLKDCFKKNRLVMLGGFISAFMILHILLKLTMFRGMGNSYSQMGIEAILQPYNFAYTIYAFIYYIAAILVAAMVIPFLYPIINFQEMSEKAKRLLSLTILFFFASVATIAYTISVREDLGRIAPRIHLRYLGPAFIILFMIFMYSIQIAVPKIIKRKRRGSIEFVTCILIFIAVVFKGITRGSAVDEYTLEWYISLTNKIGNLLPDNGETKIVYLGVIIANLLIILLVAVFHRYYLSNRKTVALSLFVSALIIMCVANNYEAYSLVYSNYYVDMSAVKEVTIIDKYFDEQADANILYLTNGKTTNKLSKCMDTYMDNIEHLYYVDASLISNIEEGRGMSVTDTEFREHIWDNVYSDINSIEYIIIENSTLMGFKKIANVEIIPEISGENYTVYRNLNPTEINVENECYLTIDDFNENEYVSVDGESEILYPGAIVYGPYSEIEAGIYKVTYEGTNLEVATFDVWSGNQNTLYEVDVQEQMEGKIVYTVNIKETVSDIEFRLYNNSDEIFSYSSVVLEKQ